MESIFEILFPELEFNLEGDTMIQCPLPHYTEAGEQFFENTPSCSVDVERDMYQCFSCKSHGTGLNFLADYLGISIKEANELKSILESSKSTGVEWRPKHQSLMMNTDRVSQLEQRYHISEETIKELKIGIEGAGKGYAFPVFLYDRLVDVITYNPRGKPKYKKRLGSSNGMIMPYDEWQHSTKPTLICAGQKDMAIARSKGFNAICITGGEGELPKLFQNSFRDRVVYIVYDNDLVGKNGANKLAMFLKPLVKRVTIIDISDTCTEKGEDLWDYFVKYEKTVDDFRQLAKDSKEFSEEDYVIAKERLIPTMSIMDATKPMYIGKTVRSNIQVIATVDSQFNLPTAITFKKVGVSEKPEANLLNKGDKRHWFLDEHNIQDALKLMDKGMTETQIHKFMLGFKGLNGEYGIKITTPTTKTVYKCTVTDIANEDSNSMLEFTAYSLGHYLESGQKYKITYSIVPHPLDGQKLTMLITDVEKSEDAISNFKITNKTKELLAPFQQGDKTVHDKMEELTDYVRGIVDGNYNGLLIRTIDLWYHSPLRIQTFKGQTLRGYLDTLLVGESRTGKSSTVEALQRTYGLGKTISLVGSSATVAGIMGGSNKVGGTFQTRAGVLPQNNEGAVIFEELGKSNSNIVQELTEARSSNKVRINRVSGSIELNAYVRMLTITNTKSEYGEPQPIAAYPNGIEIVTDLIGKAEDIARYDLIAILPEGGTRDYGYTAPTPLPTENYKERIHWVWSRKPEQVQFTKDVQMYAERKAQELNKDFDSHIKIFGTEGWIKIMRLASAVAGYLVSTDESFENIVVTEEHIDYAVQMYLELYDNDTFRLREYVAEKRRYSHIDNHGVEQLQKLFIQNPTLCLHLENVSRTSRNNLKAISGSMEEDFSRFMQNLVTGFFITLTSRGTIVPTQRFRKGMRMINKNVTMPEVSDYDVSI